MNKKYKQNLFITIIFSLIVLITLFFMYDNFAFQTYNRVVYYDYILQGKNEHVEISDLEVYHDKSSFKLTNGKLVFKDNTLLNDGVATIKLTIDGDNQQTFELSSELNYSKDNYLYDLASVNKKSNEIDLDDAKSANLSIIVDAKEVSKVHLDIVPLQQLEGANKEYRIENACISKSMMHLGSLKTTNEDILKKYPIVSLEYRYLKDAKKDRSDNDNYVVFKKITGNSSDLINDGDYGTYYLDEGSFKNKELSVVVIFSNDSDKFVFAIDLGVREVGDYYG